MSTYGRVLVTGVTGYVGQHLVRSLRSEDLTVRGFSRRSRLSIPGLSEWHQGDITSPTDVHQAVQGCDVIVHLACLPLGQSQQDPVAAFQINAAGTLNVLQAAYELGDIQIIYTSTAQVYGQPGRLPLGEEEPARPNSPYAASKLCGEVTCQSFAHSFGVPVTILRLFNVYGLAADGNERPTVEAIFLRQILDGQPPVIKGSPDEGRDFIHIDDVVQCIRVAMDNITTGEIINVGTGTLTTMNDLTRMLIELAGVPLEPFVQPDDSSPMQIQADMTKADQLLGFQPQILLDDGLAQMIEEIRQGGENH